MTKSFYQTICASLGLSLAAGLFQSWLHVQRGVDLYRLASFRSWFLVGDFIALLTASLLLTYFHHKRFKAAFQAGLVVTVSLWQPFSICYWQPTTRCLVSI
ncbi:hypothetical protein [Spirosoma linguale]|uniref:Uncharacterized protein n=1 Tax=Spirosoma linguale (strain ATCC 33905 / DSM 74 / LMG 10896 / Claus 1) TaxID=504472 RepID=D2QC04_SPILD|nr:hypothetical protein Slin_3741 [Spirosoma linguale DSM 74]